MSLTVFKSNKLNKGSMFSIKFVAKSNKAGEDFKPGGFFINIVKQTGWNEQNHIGKFSGGESVGVKIDQFEAAKILHVLERNWNLGDINSMSDDQKKSYGFYNMHKSGDQTTHINFSPWQRKTDKEQSGFSFLITKVSGDSKNSFGAALNFGEDIALREYIKLGLEHINMAGYAEDKRRSEENFNKNSTKAEESRSSNQTRSTGRTAPAKAEPEALFADNSGDDEIPF